MRYPLALQDNRVKTLVLVGVFILLLLVLYSIENIPNIIIELRCWRKRMFYRGCRGKSKAYSRYRKVYRPFSWIRKNTSMVSYYRVREQFLRYCKDALDDYWGIFRSMYPKSSKKVSKREILAFIDTVGRIEQGRACMFAWNLFGVQGDVGSWREPEDARPDYSFAIYDSGGNCRVFLGWKTPRKAARFITYVITRKILKAISEFGTWNASFVYVCRWWRGRCYGTSEEYAKMDLIRSIYADSLRFVRHRISV